MTVNPIAYLAGQSSRTALVVASFVAFFAASLAAVFATPAARAQSPVPVVPTGWEEVARQHVRDGAEKDLAFVRGDDPLVALRVCAEGRTVRMRNAIAWLPRDGRQRLMLPLVLAAGQCSKAIRVQGGPQRVTHIAFEYEAMSLGAGGAHVLVLAQRAVGTPR